MQNAKGAAIGFWNVIAKFYSKQKISDPQAYETKLVSTQKYLNLESKVLEFGCGTGSTAIFHAPKVKSILAIDSSRKMIEIANDKLSSESAGNVTFLEATVFDLDEEPASFDIILGLNVLHLIPDMEKTVRRSYELLKPGGVFVTSTACVADMSWVLKALIAFGGAVGVLPNLQFFNIKTLENCMMQAGFSILESSTPGKDKTVHFLIVRK